MPLKNLVDRLQIPGLSKWFCIISITIILAFGLWPLDFSPKNQINWSTDLNGLHFEEGSGSKGSLGGFAFTDGPIRKQCIAKHIGNSFSMEVYLRPTGESVGRISNIIIFFSETGRGRLLLGQLESNLVFRWATSVDDVDKKWKQIEIANALKKGFDRLITINWGKEQTSFYLDGKRACTLYGVVPHSLRNSLLDCIANLGSSVLGKRGWSGEIYGLAFYNDCLREGEVNDNYRWWISRSKSANPSIGKAIALYKLENGNKNQAVNGMIGSGRLLIPNNINFEKRFSQILNLHQLTNPKYLKDIILNIAGFFPLGFFGYVWVNYGFRREKSMDLSILSFVIIAGLGALLSLVIETIQIFVPARDASLADLLCNIMGTLLGAGFLAFGLGCRRIFCRNF